MGDFITVQGVKIDKADIKNYGDNFVELKNGVKIDIWQPLQGANAESYIKIDKDNKTLIGNLMLGDVTGSANADIIELDNVRFMGHIDLKDGDDRLYVKNSFTRDVNGGNGEDTLIFDDTRTVGKVKGENITYTNNSTAHNDVEGENVLFENGSSDGFNKITAKNVKYKNSF